jgi:hypothetical protein
MLRKVIWSAGFYLLITICVPAVHAQTINAASCNASDVQSALNSVTAATTLVVVPSGACSWTTPVSFTVPSGSATLTIEGSTTVNCTGTAGQSSYACTATDGTIIEDNCTTSCNSGSTSPLVITTAGASSVFRMTGFTIMAEGAGKNNGIVDFFGSSKSFRFDHNHVNANFLNDSMIQFNGTVEGVLDHNLLDLGSSGNVSNGFRIYTTYDDSIGYGDGGFSTASNWGTSDFMFMENNVFNGGAADDCAYAARFVMRYNTLNNNYVGVQTHPTKTLEGGYRGCREYEAYHNYITGSTASPSNASISTSASTALVWGNTQVGGFDHFFVANTFRAQTGQPETATPNGWGYCGTDEDGTGSNWDGNTSASTGYPCLDGVGRGETQQSLNGKYFPSRLNSSTGTIAWPEQYLEPVYLWMNTITYGDEGYLNDNVTNYNRDVYADCQSVSRSCTAGFNGTAGTGYGALASRPSTCTAGPGGAYATSPTGSYGVAYWATDANSGVGELYVCTSTNTWTAVYEPYTYPHPLVVGDSSETSSNLPDPPTNLGATVTTQ